MIVLAWTMLAFMIGLLLGLIFYIITGNIIYKSIFSRNSKIKKQIEKKKNFDEEIAFWDKNNFIDVSIQSYDNLKLFGKYLNNGSSHIALLVHGYGGNYCDMMKYASIFLKQGFDILAVDNRAHGKSEGDTVGMGWVDRCDITKWCEFLTTQNCNYKVVLFGQSMGASAVCMASAEKNNCNIVAIIEDCGFDNTYRQVCHLYKKTKLHSKLFLDIFVSYANRRNGYDMKQADCIKQLKKSCLPIFIIHGGEDDFVPTEMAYNIYNSLDDNRKQLYIVPGAKHTESYDVNEKKYIRKINEFLNKYDIKAKH